MVTVRSKALSQAGLWRPDYWTAENCTTQVLLFDFKPQSRCCFVTCLYAGRSREMQNLVASENVVSRDPCCSEASWCTHKGPCFLESPLCRKEPTHRNGIFGACNSGMVLGKGDSLIDRSASWLRTVSAVVAGAQLPEAKRRCYAMLHIYRASGAARHSFL